MSSLQLKEMRAYCLQNLKHLWDDYKVITKSNEDGFRPTEYPVDLSTSCWDNKMQISKRLEASYYLIQCLCRFHQLVMRGEVFMKELQKQIIEEMNGQKEINPVEEIRRSVDFLKSYMNKYPFYVRLY